MQTDTLRTDNLIGSVRELEVRCSALVGCSAECDASKALANVVKAWKSGGGRFGFWCAWCGKMTDHQSGWCKDAEAAYRNYISANVTRQESPARKDQQS